MAAALVSMRDPGVRAVMSRRIASTGSRQLPPGSAAGTHSFESGARDQKPCSAWSHTGRCPEPVLERLASAGRSPHAPRYPGRAASAPSSVKQRRIGPGELGRGGEGHQGAVVVEQQQKRFGLGEPLWSTPRARPPGPGRAPAARPRRRDLLELLEESGDPAVDVERLHPGCGAGARRARRSSAGIVSAR